jgi:hypothetical protein
MRSMKSLTAAVLVGATAISMSLPAAAAPLVNQAVVGQAVGQSGAPVTENVQWRRHGGYGYGHRGYGYGHRGYGYGHRGPGAGAVIGGLAAGAIIGGAIAAGQANAAASQQNQAYCSQRYRSYDPASGTYLNNDGNRYPCP